MKRSQLIALAFSVCLACNAQAGLLVNFDLNTAANTDPFSGAAVFGTATSVWNEAVRTTNPSGPISLVDDAGAATTVTVSYTRLNSGTGAPSGAYQALGRSHILTGLVVVSGLAANASYDLVIYSGFTGFGLQTFTVDGISKSVVTSSNWSSLTEGIQYVRFDGISSGGGGSVSFLPSSNVNGMWSGFQLVESVSPVPEPSTMISLGLGMITLIGVVRRTRVASR